MRVSFVKDVQKQDAMWERQHELAAEKIYAMCSDLGGFFLKVLFLYFFYSFKLNSVAAFCSLISNYALKIV